MTNRESDPMQRSVFLVGLSGSGKTVVGRALADRCGVPFVDTDELVERRAGKAVYEIFEERGEAAFRLEEASVVNELLAEEGVFVVATGGGLPTIPGMMNRLSAVGDVVYLRTAVDTLWNRLTVDPKELEKRPLLHRKGRSALDRQFADRSTVYSQARLSVSTDAGDVDGVVDEVIARVRQLPAA